jgi:spore germination protein YaaH
VDKISRSGIKILLALLAIFLLTGCYDGRWGKVRAAEQTRDRLSAWLVFWDLEKGAAELKHYTKKFDEVCYFGAYFKNDGTLMLPRELEQANRPAQKREGQTVYLNIVNDRLLPNGGKEFKTTEFLGRLLQDVASRREHIRAIVALAQKERYDGVEIDYERIWKDDTTKNVFLPFVRELYEEAGSKNLKLRVVLEPGAPYDDVKWPEGPKYVVMFYNLFGTHSGPGPKADKKFIQKTLSKMAALPEPKSVAFATGGCLWSSKGEKRFITESEAERLLAESKAPQKRDEVSGVVFFKYRKGISVYEVWYADAATLDYWTKLAEESGVRDIALWRLGGNNSLAAFKRL